MSKNTYHSIDIAKIVAALFVVSIHSEPFSNLPKDIIVDIFARIAVPFFFITSAFFFFKRKPDMDALKHYEKRLAKLYLFWFIIGFPLIILHKFIEPNESFSINLFNLLKEFIFGSTFGGSWFIMVLIEGVPIVYFLSRKISTASIIAIGVLLYAVAVSFSYYHNFLPADIQHIADLYPKVLKSGIANSFMSAFLFIATGKVMAENEDRIRNFSRAKVNIMLTVSLIFSFIEVLTVKHMDTPSSTDIFFCLPALSLTIFMFILQNETYKDLNYMRFRNTSTIIYFSHFIFVFFFVIINKHITPVNPILKYFMVVTLCLMLSYLFIKLSEKEKFKWIKFGF